MANGSDAEDKHGGRKCYYKHALLNVVRPNIVPN
jgi:hypothetical protein